MLSWQKNWKINFLLKSFSHKIKPFVFLNGEDDPPIFVSIFFDHQNNYPVIFSMAIDNFEGLNWPEYKIKIYFTLSYRCVDVLLYLFAHFASIESELNTHFKNMKVMNMILRTQLRAQWVLLGIVFPRKKYGVENSPEQKICW